MSRTTAREARSISERCRYPLGVVGRTEIVAVEEGLALFCAILADSRGNTSKQNKSALAQTLSERNYTRKREMEEVRRTVMTGS